LIIHLICIGDIALRFLDYCKNVHQDSTASVTLVDINPHMLGEGEKRFKTTPYAHSKLIEQHSNGILK
jgi:2-methoxy-6-polyprenyl-1,4-benzoquinol methylase